MKTLLKICTLVLLLSPFFIAFCHYQKRAPIDCRDILPELFQDPIQKPTKVAPFSVDYMGDRYRVKPLYDYELWGLVVSHNDIHSLADVHHDKTSFDTKDIGVIWGDVLKTNAFHEIEFWNRDFTLFARWPHRLHFNTEHLSNNHLVTDDEAVRELINEICIGDQIHFKGMLVAYQASCWRGWRKSSTTRKDLGNHACEVVFVEDLEILRSGNGIWYSLYSLGWWLLAAALVLELALIYLVEDERRRQNEQRRVEPVRTPDPFNTGADLPETRPAPSGQERVVRAPDPFYHSASPTVASPTVASPTVASPTAAGAGGLSCPKCTGRLEPVTFRGIEVDRCSVCRGIWFDALELKALKKITGAEIIDDGSPFVGALKDKIRDSLCPRCAVAMKTLAPGKASREFVMDHCERCGGVFLDAKEFSDLDEPGPID